MIGDGNEGKKESEVFEKFMRNVEVEISSKKLISERKWRDRLVLKVR